MERGGRPVPGTAAGRGRVLTLYISIENMAQHEFFKRFVSKTSVPQLSATTGIKSPALNFQLGGKTMVRLQSATMLKLYGSFKY